MTNAPKTQEPSHCEFCGQELPTDKQSRRLLKQDENPYFCNEACVAGYVHSKVPELYEEIIAHFKQH